MADVAWVEVFAAFAVSHLAGDYLLQTQFQAANKRGGLGSDRVRRRALAAHAATYTLAYGPALAWLAAEDLGPAGVALTAAAIAVPHAVQDDGRLVDVWVRAVKHCDPVPGPLLMMVDQSFHVVALLALAIVVGA